MIPQTVELDCPPGGLRPDDLIDDVIKDLGLPEDDLEARIIGRFFGEWTWNFADVDADVWAKARPAMKERVTALYHQGAIRWGSW